MNQRGIGDRKVKVEKLTCCHDGSYEEKEDDASNRVSDGRGAVRWVREKRGRKVERLTARTSWIYFP